MFRKNIIDLGHEIKTGMPLYPGDLPEPQVVTVNKDGINISSVHIGTHTGTHIDAPHHFFNDGKRLSDFSPDTFFGSAVCLRKNEYDDRAIELTQEELAFIDQYKPDWLVISTGFDKNWGNADYFLKHPFLSMTMVESLLKTNIIGIAVDFPGIDAADAHNYPVHRSWLGAGRLAVENLCNLGKLPENKPFEFCALSLKINTEGAPVRVLAFL